MIALYYSFLLLFSPSGIPVETTSIPDIQGNWTLISVMVDSIEGLQMRPEEMTKDQCLVNFVVTDGVGTFGGKTGRNQIFGQYSISEKEESGMYKLEISGFGSTKVLERGFGKLMIDHFRKMTKLNLHKSIGILELQNEEGLIFQFQQLE